MIIIFGIVIFVVIIMESYVAVKMSERMDALEEANSSLQQQINDFYDYQNREPITLDINSICTYFSGYIIDIKKDSYNINIDLILKNYQDGLGLKKHQDYNGKQCPEWLLEGRYDMTWDWFEEKCKE